MQKKIYNHYYEKIEILGKGSFGSVFKARVIDFNSEKKLSHKDPNKIEEEFKIDEILERGKIELEFVAIKKVRSEAKKGIDFSFLREVKILKELDQHPNIIKLVEVFVTKNKTYMVMEVMRMSLHDLIYDPRNQLTDADIKFIMYEVVSGLEILHRNWILHRDMKPANVLISESGQLKISDFGLARYYGTPEREMSGRVVTRGYRPPEILYGSKFYGNAVDIWSTGCIFLEMYVKRPVFYAENDIGQLSKIFALRGSPNEENWPEVTSLPAYLPFEQTDKTPFTKVIPELSPEGADLLEKMLDINPNRRISAQDALKHPYFDVKPNKSEANYQKFVKEYQKLKK